MSLFRQNEETAEVENGMATSYEVSDDGLVYTVKIMDNVPWVKYDPTKDEVVKVQDCEGKDAGHRRGLQVRSSALAQPG